MNYSYILHTPEKVFTISENVDIFHEIGEQVVSLKPYTIRISGQEKGPYRLIELTVSSDEEKQVYNKSTVLPKGERYATFR